MRMRSLYDTSSKHKYDEKPRLFTHMKGMLTEAYSMKIEGLNESLSWTLQPNTSMMESCDFSPS